MRGLTFVGFFGWAAFAATLLTGCPEAPPPAWPDPPPPPPILIEQEQSADGTPHVVRRLISEAREQMEKNRAMVTDIRDTHGRARAEDEADALDRELRVLEARANNPDSDNLDDVMERLHLLDTRIDLLHDKLLSATERTSAVVR